LVKLMMDLGLRPALTLRDPPAMQINVCSLTHVTTIIVPSALRLERTSAERQCQSA
jgi:hypothetical protein